MHFRLIWLLISEAFLCYAFETLKLHSGAIISNDFNLSIDGPLSLHVLYLPLATIFTLFVAYMTDSYVGKFYTSLFGLLLGMLAGVCFILEDDLVPLGPTSTILLIASLTTSSVRYALLTEQIRTGENIYQIRYFLFSAIAIQIAARLVSYSVFFIWSDTVEINKFIPATIIAVFCVFMIYYCERLFHLEYIYYGIFVRAAVSFYKAFKSKKLRKFLSCNDPKVRNPSTSSVTSRKKKVSIGKKNRLITKECWGYRAITNDNTNEINASQDWATRQKSRIMSTFPNDKVPVFPPTAPGQVEKPSILTKYSVDQLKILCFFFPIIIMRCSFSLLDRTIRWEAISRFKLISEDKSFFFLTVPINMYLLATDLVLLVIFEFIVFPVLRKIFKRDTWFILLGYGFLIAAASLELQVQMTEIERFEPKGKNVDLKFFNGLKNHVTITAEWLKGPYTIAPYKYTTIQSGILNESVEKRVVKVMEGKSNLTKIFNIIVTERISTSFVVQPTENGSFHLDKNGHNISYVSNFFRNDLVTSYYVLSALKSENSLLYAKFIKVDTLPQKFKMQPLHKHGKFNIETGKYIIQLTMLSQQRITITTLNSSIDVLPNRFYCFFLHHVGESIAAKLLSVQKISSPRLYTLAIIIFLSSVGNAFANVSFYVLFYLESPNKLRGVVFSLPLVFNFFISSIVNEWTLSNFNEELVITTFITSILIYFFLYILFIYFASKYPYKSDPYN